MTVLETAARIEQIFAQDGYDSYRGAMVPLTYTLPQLMDALDATAPAAKGNILLALQSLRAANRIISRTHYPSGATLYRRAAIVPTTNAKGN